MSVPVGVSTSHVKRCISQLCTSTVAAGGKRPSERARGEGAGRAIFYFTYCAYTVSPVGVRGWKCTVHTLSRYAIRPLFFSQVY